MEAEIDKRYQILLILWGSMLMSIITLFIVSVLVPTRVNDEILGGSSQTLLIAVLTAIGTFMVVLSFPVKRKFLQRSVDGQNVVLVQQGLIIACVLCEFAAVLGLVEAFLFGRRDYYLLFIIAFVGIALHFPRRDQLLAASYKKPLE